MGSPLPGNDILYATGNTGNTENTGDHSIHSIHSIPIVYFDS